MSAVLIVKILDKFSIPEYQTLISPVGTMQLQMLLFPNALYCSLYELNCVCAVTKIFTKFLPANNFCQLLQLTRKRSCTSAGNAQAQLHFRDDQQRAFGISNISNCRCCYFQTPSVVHCMNTTASAQSPKFLRNFYPQTIFANFCG